MADRPGISLDEWYPIVEQLVDTPKTRIFRTEVDLADLVHAVEDQRDPEPAVTEAASQLAIDIAQSADELGGYPIFLRTGLLSGKHDWKDTCFVPDRGSIPQHVYNIVEVSELAGFMSGGFPTDVWAVREMLPTRPSFHAFRGMPITRERRFFFNHGEVVGHHPYWPPEAFEVDYIEGEHRADTDDWRTKLDLLNADLPSDIIALTALTLKVAAAIRGAWSLDWLDVPERGWVLTDMAWAEQSFVWRDYPHAPKEDAWEQGTWG